MIKCLLISLIFLGSACVYVSGLPRHLISSRESNQVLKIFDRNGIRIKSHSPGESYDWVALPEVPQELVRMIILAEDRNFYSHHGFDFVSSIRSFFINVRKMRRVTGASTISQQVYRLHHEIPRTWTGKFRTIIGALLLENKYPKDEILTHYLNSIPYGHRLVGIKRASEVFFGKTLNELSLAEMSVLAVAPRSPSLLLSSGSAETLSEKRNELLRKYSHAYQLSEDILSYELKTEISISQDKSGWDNYHYVMRILKHPDLPQLVARGEIKTTLDSWLQKEAAVIVRSHLKKLRVHNAHNSSVIVLDNENGDVLAYLGSTSIEETKGGHFDGLMEKRQPGSALKPFTYALALEKGKPLTSILPDIPTYYKSGAGQYLPRNYDRDFTGPRLMREALANSLNLPAVALADELGTNTLYSYLKDFGLTLPKGADHYGVGLTLGNAEISPVELARSYTSFAGGEIIIEPRFLASSSVEFHPVPLKKETAYMIRDVLSDPLARREAFGDGNIFEVPFELAVKTGTSTDFRDNWAVGVNRKFTVLVWVGNMDQQPMKKVSGISGAGPILVDIFKLMMKDRFMPVEPRPQNLVKIPVCALSGMGPGAHCPHIKMELQRKNDPAVKLCSFHQEIAVKNCGETDDFTNISVVTYPEIYQNFQVERPQWTLEGQVKNLCPGESAQILKVADTHPEKIRITKPLSGSIYAIDPNIPKELQKLRLELTGKGHLREVSWIFDKRVYKGKKDGFDWVMEKGQHQIEADVELINGKKFRTEPIKVTIL